MTSRVITDRTWTFTEVYEDAELAALMERPEPVTFRVIEDEWSDDFTVRTIRRAEIVERDTPV
jgi:hypothetical protein